MKRKVERIWEIDLLRGIALILMIYFHVIYDMKEIYDYSVTYASGPNYYLGKVAGSLFIFVAGISSSITRSNIKRAVKLLALALVITAITHLYDANLGIKFGILHFLGISILTSTFMTRLKEYELVFLGSVVIAIATYTSGIKLNHDLLFFVGITTNNFISSDFYPLIPWYGVFLYGLAAGKYFYKSRKSIVIYHPKDNILTKAGRRTLVIYLIHQPAILVILELYTKIRAIL
jgi:uncharacterized membrane protein